MRVGPGAKTTMTLRKYFELLVWFIALGLSYAVIVTEAFPHLTTGFSAGIQASGSRAAGLCVSGDAGFRGASEQTAALRTSIT